MSVTATRRLVFLVRFIVRSIFGCAVRLSDNLTPRFRFPAGSREFL